MPSFDRWDNLRSEETKWFGQGGKSRQKQSRHWNLPPHALCQNQEFCALWALQGLLKMREIDRPQLFRLSPEGGWSKQMKNLWVCVWRGYPTEGTGGDRSTGFPRPAVPEVKAKVSVVSDSSPPHGLYSPWNSPGQNTGLGSRSLPPGIFPTQGSNPSLPHCRQILYQQSHKGSPRILERVAYPFSRGSSWPRNWTGVSCIAGRFFTSWATRSASL